MLWSRDILLNWYSPLKFLFIIIQNGRHVLVIGGLMPDAMDGFGASGFFSERIVWIIAGKSLYDSILFR